MKIPVLGLGIARTLHPTTSMCLTMESEIRRITITNMQIREEDPLGILHMQFLKALVLKGSGSVLDLHGFFGIGISLSRIVVVDLLSKGLVQKTEVRQSWWNSPSEDPSTGAIQFHKEEERRLVADEIDSVFVELTNEGLNVVETGKYTPTKIIPEWHCYFTLNPVRFYSEEEINPILTRFRGREIPKTSWINDEDADVSFFQSTFNNPDKNDNTEERATYGIPYDVKGPLLEPITDEETGYKTTRSWIQVQTLATSITIPTTHLLSSSLSGDHNILASYLPPKFDSKDPLVMSGMVPNLSDFVPKDSFSAFNRLHEDGGLWSRTITKNQDSPNFVRYSDSIVQNNRLQHLFIALEDPDVLDDSRRCGDRSFYVNCEIPMMSSQLELDVRLIPGSESIATTWLNLIADQIRISDSDSLDKETLASELQKKTDSMKEFWAQERFPHIQGLQAPSVESYIDRKWRLGDWKLIYQLSYKEDFPDA